MTTLHPSDVIELGELIASAAASGDRLELIGGGSKRAIGAPRAATRVSLGGFRGVVDYDPAELVLTARACTPLHEIEALVAGEGQALAFDPFDHGPVFGDPVGKATIGGVIAAGVSGSRRLAGGAARDHLLGFRAVSGRGEEFQAGGKVVKNVTGYDLPKLVTGSWGRLAAITELTLKVLPAPRATATLAMQGVTVAEGCALMRAALRTSASVVAASCLPGDGTVALRLDGFGPSIAARVALLRELDPRLALASPEEADALWARMRTLAPLACDDPLWRVSLPSSAADRFIAALPKGGASTLIDWAGSLIWLAGTIPAKLIRETVAAVGGHAMLVRAPDEVRRATPCLHPQPAPLAALEERVRRAFDPAGVFETGRF